MANPKFPHSVKKNRRKRRQGVRGAAKGRRRRSSAVFAARRGAHRTDRELFRQRRRDRGGFRPPPFLPGGRAGGYFRLHALRDPADVRAVSAHLRLAAGFFPSPCAAVSSALPCGGRGGRASFRQARREGAEAAVRASSADRRRGAADSGVVREIFAGRRPAPHFGVGSAPRKPPSAPGQTLITKGSQP